MSGVIVYAFLLAGGIVLLGLLVLFWLNGRSARLDSRSYAETFEPDTMVSRYRVSDGNADQDPDPYDALKFYKLGRDSEQQLPAETAEPSAEKVAATDLESYFDPMPGFDTAPKADEEKE